MIQRTNIQRPVWFALVVSCWSVAAPAQTSPPTDVSSAQASTPARPADDRIELQIRELRQAFETLREQLTDSRREADSLRRELAEIRGELETLRRSGPPADTSAGDAESRERVDSLAQEQELLGRKVEEQEQTKVESGSKYHMRVSGLALMGLMSTRGSVDNLDVPTTAQPRSPGEAGGAFSASVRQSFLNFEVFGPRVMGARTSGDVAVDFFGGFLSTDEGVNSPLARIRTAKVTLAWKNASVVAGQDVPFFSPRSPTSLASTAYPALSSAGNLWAWTPQVHADHRIALSSASSMTVQWGVLDPFTKEVPAIEYSRTPTAGERSGFPAEAVRVAWLRAADEQTAEVGAGAYYSRQDWGFGRTVDAWAATADWDIPLGRRVAVSGELYRGRSIAGLGGGAAPSALFDGPADQAASLLAPLESAGGWVQVKVKASRRIEFNGAFGQDNPFRSGLSRLLATGRIDSAETGRNGSGFLNAIYQARSNVLFSVEYRRLWTRSLDDARRTADHVSVSAGIGF